MSEKDPARVREVTTPAYSLGYSSGKHREAGGKRKLPRAFLGERSPGQFLSCRMCDRLVREYRDHIGMPAVSEGCARIYVSADVLKRVVS